MNQLEAEIEMLTKMVRNQDKSIRARDSAIEKVEMALDANTDAEVMERSIRKALANFKPAWEVRLAAELERRPTR